METVLQDQLPLDGVRFLTMFQVSIGSHCLKPRTVDADGMSQPLMRSEKAAGLSHGNNLCGSIIEQPKSSTVCN